MEEVVLHELRVQHVLDTVRKFLLQMDVPILVPSLERRLHVAPEKEDAMEVLPVLEGVQAATLVRVMHLKVGSRVRRGEVPALVPKFRLRHELLQIHLAVLRVRVRVLEPRPDHHLKHVEPGLRMEVTVELFPVQEVILVGVRSIEELGHVLLRLLLRHRGRAHSPGPRLLPRDLSVLVRVPLAHRILRHRPAVLVQQPLGEEHHLVTGEPLVTIKIRLPTGPTDLLEFVQLILPVPLFVLLLVLLLVLLVVALLLLVLLIIRVVLFLGLASVLLFVLFLQTGLILGVLDLLVDLLIDPWQMDLLPTEATQATAGHRGHH